ncbi:hypothetical protein [Sporomusa sp. KB1]|jgi:biopolymer transport protein ExbB/TolQ|uniref:hypothetical protein n=1 Tax=Sporomusa sp. KB1 TaxID=943346 RepID=UPI0011A6113F|nr:hypothetical protein [Sporomusa sp. KB1]TWH44967.1 hypothetical protein Salpa_0846 [Sporomusa sp. KB1]
MNKMAKKVIIFSMVGLLQFGLGVSVIEAAHRQSEPPRQEQGDDRQQQDQERERRIQKENERHEREMRRRDHESEREWHERQERERERHDKALATIAGLILGIIASGNNN